LNEGRLNQVLAELEVLADTEVNSAFAKGAQRIAAEGSLDRQDLLKGSIILDASEHIRLRIEREKVEANLCETRAALVPPELPRALELATKDAASAATSSPYRYLKNGGMLVATRASLAWCGEEEHYGFVANHVRTMPWFSLVWDETILSGVPLDSYTSVSI